MPKARSLNFVIPKAATAWQRFVPMMRKRKREGAL